MFDSDVVESLHEDHPMQLETPEQYAARLSSYVAGKDHLRTLKRTPAAIAGMLKGVQKSRLLRRPEPDRWSVAEILAHLTEAELVFGYRLRHVVGAPGTPIQAYDQNIWQNNAGYLIRDPKGALAYFTAMRAMNVAFVQSLDEEKRGRYGIHTERGRESVMRMVELFAGHDENHIRQVKAILKPVVASNRK